MKRSVLAFVSVALLSIASAARAVPITLTFSYFDNVLVFAQANLTATANSNGSYTATAGSLLTPA